MPCFQLEAADEAREQLAELEADSALKKRFKAVGKALGYLQANPRHPSLNTHKYSARIGQRGEEVFEAYAENRTPGAYRIFWHYGPGKDVITILAITPHP